MEFFTQKTQFDFIGKRFVSYALSGALIAVAVVSMATKGLNYSIDFVGGNVVLLKYQQPQDIATLRSALEKAGYPDAVPQQFTGTNSFNIRIKARADADAKTVETFLDKLRAADAAHTFSVESQEFVGPTVGKHLGRQALFAVVFSLLGIVVYVAFRFSNPVWGLAGVVALGHDVLATAGLISVLGLEFDLTLVAALLTLAGFSINDTIVIFDRMRERMTIHRREPLSETINVSVNETLSRTIITSLTVFLTVLTLLFFGGSVIHDFALAMTFGVFVGSYSTIAIATPLVFEWETRGGPQKHAAAPHEALPHAGKTGGKRHRG
ncbi:MAG: protein translocase subunit SecF [Elusimicrobia bacterium]|nr:protein translocase subunit SecF [Elusimicrobiota bacterium]